ncbi:MAG TPA: hypothetical protein VKY24_03370 [Reyranella sp.]|nr:hypothetical protein [Reyranella sp.]
MRQLLMGAVLLGAALMVTFAAASLLQGWALANRSAEPFVVEKITPDTTTAKRAPRNEPGHSVVLVSHHIEM